MREGASKVCVNKKYQLNMNNFNGQLNFNSEKKILIMINNDRWKLIAVIGHLQAITDVFFTFLALWHVWDSQYRTKYECFCKTEGIKMYFSPRCCFCEGGSQT